MRPEVIYLVTSTKSSEIYAVSDYDLAQKKADEMKGFVKILYPDSFSMTENNATERMIWKCVSFWKGKPKEESVNNSVDKTGEFF